MGLISDLMRWFKKAFSWVDWILEQYEKAKDELPGLVEYIEYLYELFRPQVEQEIITGAEARRELLLTVDQKVNMDNAYGEIIPKAVFAYILELVHLKNQAPELASFDTSDVKARANIVLKGLRNKYGDR